MKIRRGVIGAVLLFLASAVQIFAVDGLGIKAEGTNIIVSWPSSGFENYVIQYRPDLNDGTTWTTLTFSTPATIPDNYPANGYSFTTYTNFGAIPPYYGGGTNGGSQAGGPPFIGGAGTMSSASGSGTVWTPIPPVPWDTNTRIISQPSSSFNSPDGFTAEDSGTADGPVVNDGPSMGFYRVFLKPDFWYDYSQYTFTDGVEFMPVYLGVDAQVVSNVKLLVDGQLFPYYEYDLQQWDFGTPGNPDVEWTYGIWFHNDRLTNGTHQLQLVTTLQLDGVLNQDTPFITLTNPPFTTTINNPIIFQPWKNLLVGTNHTFNAKTTIFPSTWQIDVYDQHGDFVQMASGTTTDGNISWTWDFYDSQGNLRDNVEADPYFDPWVTVTQNSSPAQPNGPQAGAASVQRPAPLSSIDYPYSGGWLVAYQDNKKFWLGARYATLDMFNNLFSWPSFRGLPTQGLLLSYGNTNDVDMSPDPAQNMIDRNASWDTLRNYLLNPLYRNLYIAAHGAGSVIGGDWDNMTNDPPRGIYPHGATYDYNTYTIGNNQRIHTTAFLTSGWCYRLSPHVSDSPHPYRFVFLDGCSTATGDWPYPFGITAQTNAITYYSNDGDRPNAFVGWAVDTSYSPTLNTTLSDGWGDYQKYANFRSMWMFNWANNSQTTRLYEALGIAQQQSQWISSQMLNQYIRIYGLKSLGFNDYNARTFTYLPE